MTIITYLIYLHLSSDEEYELGYDIDQELKLVLMVGVIYPISYPLLIAGNLYYVLKMYTKNKIHQLRKKRYPENDL